MNDMSQESAFHVADSLSDLAEFIRTNPQVITRHEQIDVYRFTTSIDEARAIRKTMYTWTKTIDTSYISYIQDFGNGVRYHLCIPRTSVCERKQVGVKTIPAQEVPVWEWDCAPGGNSAIDND